MAQLANNSIGIAALVSQLRSSSAPQFSRAAYRQFCRCVAANSGAALSMPQSQLQLFICPIGATRPKSLNAAHVIFLGRSAMEWSLWD